MASAAAVPETNTVVTRATKPQRRIAKRVCFSYAAYAKNLIDHLKSLRIPILPGLNDADFSDIESTFSFTFPPDLRSILREGLPLGPAFPNWRSSSHQQLRILLNLPSWFLLKNVSRNNFWSLSWGPRPHGDGDATSVVKNLLIGAPVLVPIYRNCYVPSTPNLAGNPVFYIDDQDVRVLSFDLAGFFDKEVTKFVKDADGSVLDMPAWAAKEARRIEFWTDVAEEGRRVAARDGNGKTQRWWSDGGVDVGLGCCLEEAFWRLRDGGWREEEVSDMLMMDGCDDGSVNPTSCGVHWAVGDADYNGESVGRHVRSLSGVLLRAGWSKEDVVYSLDIQDQADDDDDDDDDHFNVVVDSPVVDDKFLEFENPKKCCKIEEDDHHQKSTMKQLMHMQALRVSRR